MSETDLEDFLENWAMELHAGYTSDPMSLLEARAAEHFGEGLDAVIEPLREETARILEHERAEEAEWTSLTHNDRITAAFAELTSMGILALECAGQTIQDGWAIAGRQAQKKHKAVVFFHREDVIDGVLGLGLQLAYGAAEAVTDDMTAVLAEEILSVLEGNGVSCIWSHSVRERIHIAPFEWRRRRFSEAPPIPRRPRAAKTVSSWTRHSTDRDAGDARWAKASELAIEVRVRRDERGFDLPRSRKIRGAWAALGNTDEAQVGHLGDPHALLQPGDVTTMIPVRASENLGSAKDALFRRGQAL